jgi:hypothetical protein
MKFTIKIIFIISLIVVCSFEIYAQNSSCEQLKENETTREGYSALIVFKEKKTFKAIRGTTVLGFEGEPLKDVFVEIFPFKSNVRVAGCRTGEDGKFSFTNLKKGKYKIKLSIDGGYKITEIHLKISPKSKNDKEIIGVVEVGT